MKRLRICYTSDTHGYFYPTDYTDRTVKPMGVMKIAAAFEKDADTLVIDGGDVLQGSPFTSYLSRFKLSPHPCARMMDFAGYDYITLGNHDFNYGLEYLGRYLQDVSARCLCANICDRSGRLPIAPYAVHTMANGLRIGIVGICTHYVARWESPDTVGQLDIREPVPAAAEALLQLEGKTDFNICIYHGGFECDLKTGEKLTDSAENEACRICRELGFDLVLTGHQHMAAEGVTLGGTYAVQPAANAANFCEIEVLFTGGKPAITSRLRAPGAIPLALAAAELLPLEEKVQAWLDQSIGRFSIPLTPETHLDMAISGTPLANFINTVQLEASGADISATSLANSVKGFSREVTVRDVVSTYIYPNTLSVLRLTGAILKEYLERSAVYFAYENGTVSVSPGFLRPKAEHYNYDYFYGLDYVFDLRRPAGSRVVSMKLKGRVIGPEDSVSVCINNYRASGTGGYDMLRGQPMIRDIQRNVSELVIEYIEKRGDVKVDTHRYLTVIR